MKGIIPVKAVEIDTRMPMDENSNQSSLSYEDSGVNIDAGNALVDSIKSNVKRTHRTEVLSNIGGFGGLFSLANYAKSMQEPVLVSGTDGVGTKLKLAMQMQQHETIGIDLVAMCVNDIVVTGAEPLFFLDYYATGKLEPKFAKVIINGISEGCAQSGAALIGGETAEMPGMYQNQDYDLAGFAVGIVDKSKIIDGKSINDGDYLLALPSSGPHSNGYSLIRKIIDVSKAELDSTFEELTLGEMLLKPTKIYVKTLLSLLKQHTIKGIAHITGGGLSENIPRILPEFTQACIDLSSWEMPKIFQWLQQNGNVESKEMLRTFNCGVGMVLVISPSELDAIQNSLKALNEPAFVIGQIKASETQSPKVTYC